MLLSDEGCPRAEEEEAPTHLLAEVEGHPPVEGGREEINRQIGGKTTEAGHKTRLDWLGTIPLDQCVTR